METASVGKIILIILFILHPISAQAFCFQEAGQRYEVSPWLLWAIARAESSLNPSAVHQNRNGTVDVGLMQINSVWADQLGKTWNFLDDPCTNVMAGAWILRQCMQDYGYTWQAVGCYHSRTPERRDAYALRIATILEQARGRK
jgi:soluble lytic murein transglycosylase-like protein